MQDNYVTIMQWVKVIGKPCKGKLYARFDERSLRRLLQIRDLLYISIKPRGIVAIYNCFSQQFLEEIG